MAVTEAAALATTVATVATVAVAVIAAAAVAAVAATATAILLLVATMTLKVSLSPQAMPSGRISGVASSRSKNATGGRILRLSVSVARWARRLRYKRYMRSRSPKKGI